MLDLRPLRSTTFRHLAAASWINQFGNWFGEIALTLLVYNRTKSPLATATLFLALRFLPALLAPPLATRVEALAARVSLPVMYTTEACLFAAIAIVSKHFTLPIVLVLSALDGVLSITSTALTRTATATTLLGVGLLREGNGLTNLGVMIATAGAPVLGSILVAWRGAGTALMIDAATFLLTAVVIATASGLRIESDLEAGFRGRLKSGVTVLRTRSSVSRLLVAIALVLTVSSVAVPIEVVFAKTTLHAGDYGYGVLLTAWGIGMIAGGFMFAIERDVRLMSVLGASSALIALGYAGLAASPTLAVACACSFIGGTGNGAAWVAAKTALQERIPLTNQSAVMAVLEAVNQVMPALGFIVGGVVTAASTPRAAYAISAVGVAVVILFFILRPIDRVPLMGADDSMAGDTARDHAAVPQEMEPKSRTPVLPKLPIG